MKKLFKNTDIENYSKIYNFLGFKEVKRSKTLFLDTSLVTYEKEREVKNYQVLRDKYAPHSTVPFFFVVFFVVIAISLATAYLIVNLVNKDIDKMFYFYTLMLPTSIATLIATGISFYRYFNELKNMEKVVAIPLLKKEVEQNDNHN